MNLMKEIAEKLGVSLGERFRVHKWNENLLYFFDEYGLHVDHDPVVEHYHLLYKLLNGTLNIIPLSSTRSNKDMNENNELQLLKEKISCLICENEELKKEREYYKSTGRYKALSGKDALNELLSNPDTLIYWFDPSNFVGGDILDLPIQELVAKNNLIYIMEVAKN